MTQQLNNKRKYFRVIFATLALVFMATAALIYAKPTYASSTWASYYPDLQSCLADMNVYKHEPGFTITQSCTRMPGTAIGDWDAYYFTYRTPY